MRIIITIIMAIAIIAIFFSPAGLLDDDDSNNFFVCFFYLLASLMRKGAVSTATFPSTDFCLVNGGPIVAFPSSYMPVARFFLFLYAFCLCKCLVYWYIMNKALIFPALIFAYLLSLYWKCGRKFWQTVPGRWTYWRFVEMKLPIWDGSHFFCLAGWV